MSAKLKVKRGTTESWSKIDGSVDTTLEPGQLGVEYCTDGTTKMKVGSNITANYSPTTAASITATKTDNVVSGTGLTLKVAEGCKYRIKVDEVEYDYIAIKQDSMYTVGNYSLKTDCTAAGDPFLFQGGTWYFKEAGTYTVQYKMIGNRWNTLKYITPLNSKYFTDSGLWTPDNSTTNGFKLTSIDQSTSSLDPVGTGYIGSYSPIKQLRTSSVLLDSIDKFGSTVNAESTNELNINILANSGSGYEQHTQLNINLQGTSYTSSSPDDASIIMRMEGGTSGNIDVYPSNNYGTLGSIRSWNLIRSNYYYVSGAKSGTSYATTNPQDMPTQGTIVFSPPTFASNPSYLPEYSSIIQKVNNAGSSETGIRAGTLFLGCESAQYSNGSTVGKAVSGLRMYSFKQSNYCSMYVEPMVTTITGSSLNFNSYLGTSTNKWQDIQSVYMHANTVYLSNLYGSSDPIKCNSTFAPTGDATSSTGCDIGTTTLRWKTVYAYKGVVQTSDRSEKDSIHYITNYNDQLITLASDDTTNSTETINSEGVTMDDVLDFVSTLNPATFCYKNGKDNATEDNSDPEDIQLGFIADDIKDHKLFKYVGVENEADFEVTPAELDEFGNEVTPAVTEKRTTRGLQAIPLATTALTACKYLINKIQELDARIEELESK